MWPFSLDHAGLVGHRTRKECNVNDGVFFGAWRACFVYGVIGCRVAARLTRPRGRCCPDCFGKRAESDRF